MSTDRFQLSLLRKEPLAYGGELLKTRKGRANPRPLDTKNTMHLVLRSSRAVKDWSFRRPENEKRIRQITAKFSQRFNVRIISVANVGNHLHFQIKLNNRYAYKPFIRALTSAIAMAVTGSSRWNPNRKKKSNRFWDYRPFTRVILGLHSVMSIRNYLEINKMEGMGFPRFKARFLVKKGWRAAEVALLL